MEAADGWRLLISRQKIAMARPHYTKLPKLGEKGANVEAKDGIILGNTALHWAAFHGHTSAERLLVEKGADIEATNGMAG
jgi:ankyrin repeat protein